MMNTHVRRRLLLSAGVLSVGLGIVGILLPLLPTTPFLLLAAACFARSSDRHYQWLTSHGWLGARIRNYHEQKATTRGVKVVTLTFLWGSIGYAAIAVAEGWVLRTTLLCVAAAVTVHVARLKVLPVQTPPDAADALD